MNSNYVEGNSPSSTTSCSGNAILQQPQTYVHPWYIARQRLENIIQSAAESTLSQKLETIGLKHIEANRKGDIAEQFVAMVAATNGAEVFKNTNCTGEFDIVLYINKQFVPIDVKTAYPCLTNAGTVTWKHGDIGNSCSADAYPVYVIPETDDIRTWTIRWCYLRGQGKAKNPKYRCPAGLEGFWS